MSHPSNALTAFLVALAVALVVVTFLVVGAVRAERHDGPTVFVREGSRGAVVYTVGGAR